MKILLVYPQTPETFWSFSSAVRFISKRAADIPLGLVTIAAMLPKNWEKRLIDMNVSRLKDKDLLWADYVFLSGMNVQRASFLRIVNRCNQLGVKVVAGGPLATTEYRDILGVDHFVLNEAEATLQAFIDDLQNGCPQPVYQSAEFPSLEKSPAPQWNLLKMNRYAGMGIQYSRGCPFDCEFCSITMLNGHHPRTKTPEQFLAELQSLYEVGWRGGVFIVDDNFIGNKTKLKKQLLPALIKWSKERGYPFKFTTEVSINLADDDELVGLMVAAGFHHAFVGIETPDEQGLAECGKKQNQGRDLVSMIKRLQRQGLIVSGGFIVGFDSDTTSIFERQIHFIQKSGIVTAMVGMLNAPVGTKLFKRLHNENRLLGGFNGNNMDGSINFIPRMHYPQLVKGYKHILESIYAPQPYYERVKTFLREYRRDAKPRYLKMADIRAFFKSIWKIGMLENGKRYYWKLLLFSLLQCPRNFAIAVEMAIYGFHFRRIVRSI
ncbi:MAG: DUF4070 domain-containing protein [Calditrichaeota bacterium]|nr:MAG: DUF4070 domain-containing protein [Calditrichota bacterium]